MLRKAGLLIDAIIQRRLVILKVSLLLLNDFRLLEWLQGLWKNETCVIGHTLHAAHNRAVTLAQAHHATVSVRKYQLPENVH